MIAGEENSSRTAGVREQHCGHREAPRMDALRSGDDDRCTGLPIRYLPALRIFDMLNFFPTHLAAEALRPGKRFANAGFMTARMTS